MKKISIIFLIIALSITIFCGCSNKAEETENSEVTNDLSVRDEIITELKTDSESEAMTEGSTKNNILNESEIKSTTNIKQPSKSNSKTQSTTQSTTSRQAVTTALTTTQVIKHISPYDMQKTINDYIISKGATLDSSLKPIDFGGYAGYYVPTSGCQEGLDDGTTLRDLKDCVDYTILKCGLRNMYCYYNTVNEDFYVLYS